MTARIGPRGRARDAPGPVGDQSVGARRSEGTSATGHPTSDVVPPAIGVPVDLAITAVGIPIVAGKDPTGLARMTVVPSDSATVTSARTVRMPTERSAADRDVTTTVAMVAAPTIGAPVAVRSTVVALAMMMTAAVPAVTTGVVDPVVMTSDADRDRKVTGAVVRHCARGRSAAARGRRSPRSTRRSPAASSTAMCRPSCVR